MTRSLLASLFVSLALVACGDSSPSSSPECGDGAITGSEQCDDGNTNDGDGCSSTCRTETDATCGDGVVDSTEECDDMNATADDGCTECAVDPGFTCTGAPSVCELDEGPQADGSCSAPFVVTLADDGMGGLAGNAIGNTTGGTSHVPEAACDGDTAGGGNDLVFAFTLTETSDVDIFGPDDFEFDMILRLTSTACDLNTQVPDYFTEGCDDFDPEALLYTALPAGTYYLHVDGYDDQEAGMFDVEIYAYPTACGDGVVDALEDCDDADGEPGDGCSAACTIEDGYECDGEPSVCMPSACGNGTLDDGEECDDSDMEPGDGCDEVCEIESGWSCTGKPSTCIESCGNNAIEAGEECDDGGETPGDGCSDTCQIEPGWTCTGTPSTCEQTCNDGTFDFAIEECDDGNAASGDGCSATCELEYEVLETEANDATPQELTYTLSPLDLDARVRVKGSFSSPTDVDLYSFTLTAPAYVYLETYDAIDGTDNYDGIGDSLFVDNIEAVDCYDLDTTLHLYGSGADYTNDLAALYSDDDDGDVFCSSVSWLDPADDTQALLQPGTYVVKVRNDIESPLYIFDLYIFQAFAPGPGDLVINEVMTDPAGDVDTNCDGSLSSTDDEYIEIVNDSQVFIDLTGVVIEDLATIGNAQVRHEFLGFDGPTREPGEGPTGLLPGEAIVVWSGGAPACVGVDNWFVASTGALMVNNDNESMTLVAADGTTELATTGVLGTGVDGVSFNRDVDVTGATFVLHDQATGADRDYSPGTRVDGSAFP